MLKSLEKLKSGCWFPPGREASNPDYFVTKMLANEIQGEIYRDYMPKSWDVADLQSRGVVSEDIEQAAGILREYGSVKAYTDRFFLPRPLFEDGEPADFGDEYMDGGKRKEILWIQYMLNGTNEITAKDLSMYFLGVGKRLKRPPEPDTQEKIDADVDVGATEYCNKYDIDYSKGRPGIEKCRHLLARQRKLDGEE